MTQYNPAVFPEGPPPPPPLAPAGKGGNGLGLASLIIGILALVGAVIPLVNYVSGFVAFVGLVLGVVALFLANRRKGAAIAGTILNLVAIVLSIVLAIVYTAGFATGVSNAIASAQASSSAGSTPGTVVYEVTGTATASTIVYSKLDAADSGVEQLTDQPLPFTEEQAVQTGGDFDFQVFTLSATNGADDAGEITCRITLDGEVIAEQTNTGAFATALCTATP